MLTTWRETATVHLTRRLANARSSPAEHLQDLISLPFLGRAAARAARTGQAIRAWARRDGLAREAVDEADAARIGHHASLFAGLGFSEKKGQHRAFLLYSQEVADSLLGRQGSAAQKKVRRTFVERLVVSSRAAD